MAVLSPSTKVPLSLRVENQVKILTEPAVSSNDPWHYSLPKLRLVR